MSLQVAEDTIIAGMRGNLNREDGTTTLLRTGFSTIAVGLLAIALTWFVFGGIGPQGARSNAGWLFLIVFLMSTPFGVLLSVLGIAKWFRNRGLARVTRT